MGQISCTARGAPTLILNSRERERYSQDAGEQPTKTVLRKEYRREDRYLSIEIQPCWLATKIVAQQKQREGIPEGGPIPQHRDTTIYLSARTNPRLMSRP